MGKEKTKIIGKPPPDCNFCVGKETRVYRAFRIGGRHGKKW